LAVSLYAGQIFLEQPERFIIRKLIMINIMAIKIRRRNFKMQAQADANKTGNDVSRFFALPLRFLFINVDVFISKII
jgi:hypothetical protein